MCGHVLLVVGSRTVLNREQSCYGLRFLVDDDMTRNIMYVDAAPLAEDERIALATRQGHANRDAPQRALAKFRLGGLEWRPALMS